MWFLNSKMKKVLTLAQESLRQEDYNSVKALAEHGEEGLALEVLCEQAHEYEIRISRALFDAVDSAGKGFGLQQKYVDMLRALIAE